MNYEKQPNGLIRAWIGNVANRDYFVGYGDTVPGAFHQAFIKQTATRNARRISNREAERNSEFNLYPGLSDYIACALQDLQYSESDEACTDGRDARNTGTIYDLHSVTYDKLRDYFVEFLAECAPHIETVTNASPGDDGFQYCRNCERLTHDGIGSTYWLAQCGSGVTFTDDGDSPALQALTDYARLHSVETLYFGDDGKVYSC